MLQCILRTKRGVVLNLAILGGNFLRKYNVPEPGRWPLAGVWRLPLPLFGGSKCVKSMLKSIRTLRFGRCREVSHCWEGPLTEVPLYSYSDESLVQLDGVPRTYNSIAPLLQ